MNQSTKDVVQNDKSRVAIRVQKLHKRYGNVAAVNDVSFTVYKGEILGFLGPNGAGKTTTMRMLTGYLSPTKGAVMINGSNIFDDPLWVKRQIGYLPETPPLYTEMTVRSYLEHVAHLKGIPHRFIQKEIENSLTRCDLHGVQHRLIEHLSKGFRQRVGLGQALLGSPPVLILDEPTVGLDPAQIREIRSLIQDLAQDHTVILSTHILPEVQKICDRVIIIHDGQLVASDTIENINKSISDEVRVRVTLAQPNTDALSILKSYPGVTKVVKVKANNVFELHLESEDPSLLSHLMAQGLSIAEFQNVSMTLEELFLRIVSGGSLEEFEDSEDASAKDATEDIEEDDTEEDDTKEDDIEEQDEVEEAEATEEVAEAESETSEEKQEEAPSDEEKALKEETKVASKATSKSSKKQGGSPKKKISTKKKKKRKK